MSTEGSRRGDVGVVACGAIAADIMHLAAAHGLGIDVHSLPALLHNRPERIASQVDEMLERLSSDYQRLAVAYADCGTYGALDDVCRRRQVPRMGGSHCYDVYAGVERMRAELEAQPGTYVLTDFLALTFQHTVLAELGLDRYPDLRDDYFRHYTRIVWLAARRTPQAHAAAIAAAGSLGLPLEIIDVGLDGLLADLTALLA